MKKAQLIASVMFSLSAKAALSPIKLFPVKKNRVMFLSFRGKQYSCNPRAISEELEKAAGGKIEIIWAFHEPEKFAFLKERGINVISDRGIGFVFKALTSRAVVTNTYYKPYLPRRKDQFYLRTWHGGGAYKRVDYPKGLLGFYIKMQQAGASLYLSSSKAFTDMTLKGSFGYGGEIMEIGMPRNDCLAGNKWFAVGQQIKDDLGLKGKKIALYAPTYRDNDRKVGTYPDAEKLKRALNARFGGEWSLLYRGHHAEKNLSDFKFDKDVSDQGDMQPLLMAADVLITDYSSSIWDFSLTYKPAFLFCPDLGKFKAERDFYTPMDAWPYPYAENDAELESAILSYDEEESLNKIKAHHETLKSQESGKASKLAAERLIRECER